MVFIPNHTNLMTLGCLSQTGTYPFSTLLHPIQKRITFLA